jgi:hypothetical protein
VFHLGLRLSLHFALSYRRNDTTYPYFDNWCLLYLAGRAEFAQVGNDTKATAFLEQMVSVYRNKDWDMLMWYRTTILK